MYKFGGSIEIRVGNMYVKNSLVSDISLKELATMI